MRTDRTYPCNPNSARTGLNVSTTEDGSLRLEAAHCRILASTPAPTVRPIIPGVPHFSPGSSQPCTLAGTAGIVLTHSAQHGPLEITREIFSCEAETFTALRLRIVNRGDEAVHVGELVPLCAEGADAVRIGDAAVEQWRVVRMARHKNDVPGCYRPATEDKDSEHALVDSNEVSAGMGIMADGGEPEAATPVRVGAEPCVCLHSDSAPDLPGLFVGVLGQTRHLVRIDIETTGDRQQLASFRIVCEFDGALLAPGAECRTHWVLLWEEPNEQDMLAHYAELLAAHLNVPVPGTPPVYFCSWYFYGAAFTEDDLAENLAALARRPVPFDVFLIDNCWINDFGSWDANDRFPHGMQHAAERIHKAGYKPGIWTAPFCIMEDSPVLKTWPNLIVRDSKGEPCILPYKEADTLYNLRVVDPTRPEAEEYFNTLYAKIRAWGFRHHKFDFLRALVTNPDAQFHDPSFNRAMAYRRGLALIRKAIGADGYILACGGLFEGSAGLVDGNRSGSDVRGRWYEENRSKMGYLVRIKQNVFRNHHNRLWHTDPDALQIRRRAEPFRGNTHFAHLSVGSLTDDEAFTSVVNQYIGGGITCLCERMADLDEDRRLLYRHVMPVAAPPARMLDPGHPECPTLFLTRVRSPLAELGQWWTLAVANWSDDEATRTVSFDMLRPHLPDARYTVFEFATQELLGLHHLSSGVTLAIPAHGARILRIAPWTGNGPALLGSDLHFTGGAAEISDISFSVDSVAGTLQNPWNTPARINVGWPSRQGIEPATTTVPAGETTFAIRRR